MTASKARGRAGARRQWVYRFGAPRTDGHAGQRALLGGKGANLAQMCRLGLPVPPGFTITTEACARYSATGRWPAGLAAEVDHALGGLERAMRRGFGDAGGALLVSVRSGAAASMPGMMDTVLNLGLNDQVVAEIAAGAAGERFAWAAYRRLVNMFGEVVMEIPHHRFEQRIARSKRQRGAAHGVRAGGG